MTKLKRNIFMFAATIIIFSVMLADYIVLKSYSNVNYNFINMLTSIYLDKSDLDDETYEKLKKLTLSGNIKIYEDLMEDKNNPVSVFYGFAGLLKSDQTKAIDYIKSDLLLSPAKCSIINENKTVNTYLGYAILKLISGDDFIFSSDISDEFITSSENYIYEAFKSKVFSSYSPYKQDLHRLITERYDNVTKKIIPELSSVESFKNLSKDQKDTIANFIDFFDNDTKNSIITDFLDDNNKDFRMLALSKITSKSDTSFAPELRSLIRTEKNGEVAALGIRKYALLTKKEGISGIKGTIYLNQKKSVVVKTGLEEIAKYATVKEYDYFTIFLNTTKYSTEVNNAAIDAITGAIYPKEPTKASAAFAFVIGRSNYSTAKRVIDFYIKNNITTHKGTILYRLKQNEPELKDTTLDYIKHFNLKDNSDMVEKLTSDGDEKIAEKAKQILEELK